MPVKPIPDGFHTVTPYLTVRDATAVVEFVQKAFGAKVVERIDGEDGKVRHADVMIGDSHVMIGQAREPWTPRTASLYLYVEDTDAWYRRAMEAGAKSIMEPADQFYGDRNAGVEDSEGTQWWIATHVEDVSEEELQRRMKAAGRT